jgi:hypothetical protein
VVARAQAGYTRPDRLNDTSTLMAQHRRVGNDIPQSDVGMAHSGSGDTDQCLSGARVVQLDLFEEKSGLGVSNNCSVSTH